MIRDRRVRRMAVVVVALTCVALAGCDTRAVLDAVESGFYGWISSTTAQLLSSFVPFP